MTNRHLKRPEILAPCGSYDILKAAINAGSDACYIGGDRFSARAYAENINSNSILKSIDYAHLHEVKLYLTVNTLFKNNEISELESFLLPYYEGGIDAVIVQDLGVFSIIRKLFPDLSIHLSTQMNITSVHAARAMKKQGAVRVVTAREMPLSEIKAIKENVDIEIETFCHGAMCYAYSGQCLLSSLAGGRSGNRGRCAQPCRKVYDNEYILSMKDMCSLLYIPQLIEAGIDSLKIEGRMKNEYYVASSVDAYKNMCDDYINGSFSEKKAIKYKERLENIYNRGSFTKGYFFGDKGRDMLSMGKSGNTGVFVGDIEDIKDGKISFTAKTDIYKQDVLEIEPKRDDFIELTSPLDIQKNTKAMLNAPRTRLIKKGMPVYRTRCNKILDDVSKTLINNNKRLNMRLTLHAKTGDKLSLCGNAVVLGKEYEIKALSDYIAEPSKKQPVDRENIKSKLTMTNDTNWCIEDVIFDIDDNSFIPAGELKKLRRGLIDKMNEAICRDFRKTAVNLPVTRRECQRKSFYKPLLKVSVMTLEQLKAVINANGLYGVYLSKSLYNEARKDGIIDELNINGIKIYITLPYVIKSDFDISAYLKDISYDGIYIRNIDGFFATINGLESELSSDVEVVCGNSFYAYNDYAADFMESYIENIVFEAPYELNYEELKKLDLPCMELNIYGHPRVMLAENCVSKNKYGCDKNNPVIRLTDEKNNTFFAVAYCEECKGLIYNGVPLCLFKGGKKYVELEPFYVKLDFTVEDAELVKRVISDYEAGGTSLKETTMGHMLRGVE